MKAYIVLYRTSADQNWNSVDGSITTSGEDAKAFARVTKLHSYLEYVVAEITFPEVSA